MGELNLRQVPIGDQPSDIEKQTRNLISEYIAKPNSIILAVSPANVDIVNSEALKLARHVDPMGRRTIGVLTKLDLMDHGTNAIDILSGRVYPLKLGFIGVVNRSQQDIQGNKSLADALQAERDFFRHHPAYRNMAHRCGTQFLAKTLNTTLKAHIRERLPDIKARLNTLMGQTQQELASYGDVAFTGKEHRGSLILQLMTRFASSFISSIDGTSSEISTKELGGGARIYYIFNSVFGNSLETIDPNHSLSILDIRTAIRNSTGPRPSLFVPELAFDLLVKPQIKLLEIPSQRCVELVYEELIKICHTCGSNELSRYPRLQAKLIEVVSNLLRERLGPCSTYVESLISIQRAYINTNHPNFLGAAAAMSSVISDRQDKERKALAAEEKRRRDRRRQKELNGVNGELQEQDEGEDVEAPASRAAQLPTHTRGHASKPSRSMSPAVGHRTSVNGIPSGRAGSPSRFGASAANANARDSFLNYFFGKDGNGQPTPMPPPGAAHHSASGSRHVSQNVEPSFAASLRRGDTRVPERLTAEAESVVEDVEAAAEGRGGDDPLVVRKVYFSSSQPVPPTPDKRNANARLSRRTAHRHGARVDGARGTRDGADPAPHLELLQHCARVRCGPGAQGGDAPARQPQQGGGAEPARQRAVPRGSLPGAAVRGRRHPGRAREVREAARDVQERRGHRVGGTVILWGLRGLAGLVIVEMRGVMGGLV